MIPDTPSTLYHYTTLDAFIGMVANKQIWLSHARFLNDLDEIRKGQEVLSNALRWGLGGECEEADHALLDPLEQGITSMTDYYVTCFSTSRDLLSLWRGYGHRGGSVCIEFDMSDSEYFKALHGFGDSLAFHPVIYGDGSFVASMGSLFKRYMHSPDTGIELLLELMDEDTIGKAAFRIANPFLGDIVHAGSGSLFESFRKDRIRKLLARCSPEQIQDLLIKILSHLVPLIKNEFFKEEGEVRLVLNPYKSDEVAYLCSKVLRHRISSINMIVPYIRTTDLIRDESAPPANMAHLPIRSVMIGPSQDASRIADSVRSFIHHHKELGAVEVLESQIPYRG